MLKKILKYPIKILCIKYDIVAIENADTHFTAKMVGIYPMHAISFWSYFNHAFEVLLIADKNKGRILRGD